MSGREGFFVPALTATTAALDERAEDMMGQLTRMPDGDLKLLIERVEPLLLASRAELAARLREAS